MATVTRVLPWRRNTAPPAVEAEPAAEQAAGTAGDGVPKAGGKKKNKKNGGVEKALDFEVVDAAN